jgi:hypothetical protein
MATEYGMTRLGLARRPPQGPELPSDVLEVVNELLAEALDAARLRLTEYRGLLSAVVEELLDRETLTKADLDRLRAEHAPSVSISAVDAPKASIPAQPACARPPPAVIMGFLQFSPR